MVLAPMVRSVAVEGAFGWLDEDRPTELALHIHLLNLKNSDKTLVGVSAQDGRAATLCQAGASCDASKTAHLPKAAPTVLRPEDDAYITLASAKGPFQDGEVTLIERELASGQRVPVDVMVRSR